MGLAPSYPRNSMAEKLQDRGRRSRPHGCDSRSSRVRTGPRYQTCQLVALAEPDSERARRFLADIGMDIPVFPSVDALARSGICNAAVVVTPTDNHREHAATLISAGYRVMLEKPLTGTLEADRAFGAELDRDHPHALMLAFQRRFDEPLLYAKQLMEKWRDRQSLQNLFRSRRFQSCAQWL